MPVSDMNTLAIAGMVVAILAVLIAYQVGYRVGKRDGFSDGKREANKDATMRAYAVGYDRGKRAKETEAPPTDSPAPRGCALVLLASVLVGGLLLAGGIVMRW